MQVIKAEVGIVFSRVRIFENSSRGLAAAKKWLSKEAGEINPELVIKYDVNWEAYNNGKLYNDIPTLYNVNKFDKLEWHTPFDNFYLSVEKVHYMGDGDEDGGRARDRVCKL